MKKLLFILGMFLLAITMIAQPPNPQPRQGCALFNFYVGLPPQDVFIVHSNQPSNITLPMVGDWSNATIEVKGSDPFPTNWAICLSSCSYDYYVSASASPHINTTWYLKPGHAYAQVGYTVKLTKAGCPTDEEPIRYVKILP